jgi:hypothetical protein
MFYRHLRTGKRLAEGQRIISIAFREPPKSMFPAGSGVGAQGPDHLTFDLADASKMSLSFYGKRPGPGMRLDKLSLQFAMHDTGMIGDVLEAYERLILDAMRGDRTLFTTAEGIERLWQVSTALIESPPPVRFYSPGSWGPNAIHQLVAPRAWKLREPPGPLPRTDQLAFSKTIACTPESACCHAPVFSAASLSLTRGCSNLSRSFELDVLVGVVVSDTNTPC